MDKLQQISETFELLPLERIEEKLMINSSLSGDFPAIHQALFARRCGALSAIKITKYYAKQFVQAGGEIRYQTEIKDLELSHKEQCYPPWEQVKMLSVRDQNGKTYSAGKFIFTTGAWTDALLRKIGIASQIYPKKRQIFTLKIRDPKQFAKRLEKNFPVIILPAGGVYVKPVLQNHILMVGCANDLGNPFQMNGFPPKAEDSYFTAAIEPVLNHYFSNLNQYSLFSKWAGYYAYYWPDKNPIIEAVANIFWVSGTSGSGIMKADAIGRVATGRVLGMEKVDLFDGREFATTTLSLKHRQVDPEELSFDKNPN